MGSIRINEGKSKNARRTVSITERVRSMLQERRKSSKTEWVFPAADGTPMLVSSLDHLHNRVRESLQLDPEFVIHSLRHTWGTRSGESGMDAFTLMKSGGWSDIKTAERYVHPTPEAMERAVERLDSMNQEAAEKLKEADKRPDHATFFATSQSSTPVNH